MPARAGCAKYLMLVLIQAVGFGIVMASGVPIYRQMAADFSKHQPQPGILWWAAAGVTLIQSAYWLRVRLQPPMPRRGGVVLGHLVMFLGRLSFILASSTFSLMIFTRFEELSLPAHRILMLVALLFSMFCFSLELERLGRSLSDSAGIPPHRTNKRGAQREAPSGVA